jgi:anti-sigma-K factor RskA
MNADAHVLDLLPAYALGCLDEDEVKKLEDHIERCRNCRDELVTYRSMTNRILLAVPSEAPPDDLKEKILASVSSPVSTRGPHGKRRVRGVPFGVLRPLRAAILAAVILALAAGNLIFWHRLSDFRGTSQLEKTRMVLLDGTKEAPAAKGYLFLDPTGTSGIFIAENLPPLGAARQYQLWLIEDDERVSGGVFSVDQRGYAWLPITAQSRLKSYTAFGISTEPFGGSDKPTGPRVLFGAF